MKDVAKQFRVSYKKWLEFADALLPSRVEPFGEVKKLLLRKHELFINQGEDGASEIEKVNARLKKIETEITKKFPLTDSQVVDFRAELREHVLGIAKVEKQAIEMLQASMK